MCEYLLGSKDHFEADREAIAALLKAVPIARTGTADREQRPRGSAVRRARQPGRVCGQRPLQVWLCTRVRLDIASPRLHRDLWINLWVTCLWVCLLICLRAFTCYARGRDRGNWER